MPRRGPMHREASVRRTLIQRIQRIFALIGFAALLGIILIVARAFGMALPWPGDELGLAPRASNRQVMLISGHAGFDSGAVCADAEGNVTLTEAEVNAAVAEAAAARLRRSGADVTILDEYDPRLEHLVADVLISLHADSCIDASGYKAAYFVYSAIPDIESRLLACIDEQYAAVTGLPHHPNTVTHDMTEYHAFRRIDPETPAAILELGFLGGDRELLTQEVDRVARGVAESVRCFLNPPAPETRTTETPTTETPADPNAP